MDTTLTFYKVPHPTTKTKNPTIKALTSSSTNLHPFLYKKEKHIKLILTSFFPLQEIFHRQDRVCLHFLGIDTEPCIDKS